MPMLKLEAADLVYDPARHREIRARLWGRPLRLSHRPAPQDPIEAILLRRMAPRLDSLLPALRQAQYAPPPPLPSWGDYRAKDEVFDMSAPGAVTEARRIYAARDRWLLLVRLTCQAYSISQDALFSDRRMRPLTIARHDLWWCSSKLLKWSLPRIAKRSDRLDHTTILHGIRKMETQRQEGRWQSKILNAALAHEVFAEVRYVP